MDVRQKQRLFKTVFGFFQLARSRFLPTSSQPLGGFADNYVLRILIEGYMRRFQIFEIEDQAWLPNSIRDALTDYLQFVTDRT